MEHCEHFKEFKMVSMKIISFLKTLLFNAGKNDNANEENEDKLL